MRRLAWLLRSLLAADRSGCACPALDRTDDRMIAINQLKAARDGC